jgi:signal transduction histidine kinase
MILRFGSVFSLFLHCHSIPVFQFQRPKNSNLLFKEMTDAIEETKDAPKELVKLLQEIRLLTVEIKATVTAAKKSQSELAQSANNARDVLYELAIASFILAMSEERIISYAEADLMILQSIETIEGRSERFGKLANSIIDYRKRKR